MQASINIMQDWLSARAIATPNKIFLQDDISFSDMDSSVSVATALLKNHGITTGDRVAILLDNNYVTLLLALMRLHSIIVPINTRLTIDEIVWQIQHTECKCLISSRQNLHSIPDIKKLINIDIYSVNMGAGENIPIIWQPVSDSITQFVESELKSQNNTNLKDPLAIIHTSGTSGQPKGAVLTYNNIFQSAMASAYRIGVLPNDRWLCVLPLYHVGGLSIILRSLLYGTAVELMDKFDVDAVNHALTHRPITLVSLVPTMLHRLLDARREPWNPKLRLVLLGGAAPSPELVARCVDEGIPLATTYGLSEAASQVATSTPQLVMKKPASVGKPLMFTQVRILNEADEELSPNEIGEIIVKAPTIMQGYYNNPSATARALREGWLHTGDMGYKDDEGDLFIVQRRSDLIVTGGENVYPAEVENILRQHPDIQECVVVGISDAEWGQKVVSAIQLNNEATPSTKDIITFARQHLAGYKIPREFRFVTDFPQTGSGKIQRPEVRKRFEDNPTND